MRSAARLHPDLVWLFAGATLAAACVDSSSARPVAEVPSIQPPAASAAATASAPKAPPQGPLAAFNDPGAVAELAKDCHWKPAEDAPTAAAFSCNIELEQSCNRSDCDDILDACVGGCTKACGTCSEQCAKTCDDCKTSCKDDACKAACAKTTGDCRQACLSDKDHCGSGECAKADAACEEKFHKEWEASGCSKLVPKFTACVEKMGASVTDFGEVWKFQQACVQKVMQQRGKPDCSRFFPFYRIF